MEAKLAAFRQKKEEEKKAQNSLINRLKLVVVNSWKGSQKSTSLQAGGEPKNIKDVQDHGAFPEERAASVIKRSPSTRLQNQQELTNTGSHNRTELINEYGHSHVANSSSATVWLLRILKFLLWLCLWGLFIELQFGAVFFAISTLIFVYFNTRTGPKDDKPSAYSVFNKDCERIGGTMTAEQLQKQMFGVPGLPS